MNPREEFKAILFFVSLFVYLINSTCFFIMDTTHKKFEYFKYWLIPSSVGMLLLHMAYYLA